jgi:predicted metal-dependent hydrolase
MTSPTVLDVRRREGRLLARVEIGDVSVLVEAPEHVSEAELESALGDVPETLVEYADRFDRVDRGDRVVADGGPRLRPEWTAEDVERELNAVLEHAEDADARYHARQALQHLKVFEHTGGEQP